MFLKRELPKKAYKVNSVIMLFLKPLPTLTVSNGCPTKTPAAPGDKGKNSEQNTTDSDNLSLDEQLQMQKLGQHLSLFCIITTNKVSILKALNTCHLF